MEKAFKEVIVVEGHHDEALLKAVYPTCDVVITNGTEISSETLKLLKHLNEERGLILILDPDYPGKRIRHIINQHVGETKHVFLDKEACIDHQKNKIGLEHASKDYIKTIMTTHLQEPQASKNPLEIKDLIALKLTGNPYSKRNRDIVSNHFHIGKCNAKTLLNRLNMFNITKSDIQKVMA